MDVAITGSHGLIGSALRASLEADGHTVVPVVRSDPGRGRRAVRWDPEAGTIDAAGLEGLDAVVHLAGENIGSHRWTDEQKRRIRESRTRGTATLAEALAGLDRKPAVLVSASAIGFYGDRGDEILTEASGPGDDFLSGVCVDWEAAADPARDAGIRVVHPRTGIVLTPADGALKRLLPLFKLFVGGRLGSGRQWWSWISLTDEVAALRYLVDSDLSGPVNLTAPGPVTNREFTEVLGRVLGRPTLLPVPAFGPKLVVGSELADALLFTSQRVRPTVLEGAGFPFRHPVLETALRAELDRPAA